MKTVDVDYKRKLLRTSLKGITLLFTLFFIFLFPNTLECTHLNQREKYTGFEIRWNFFKDAIVIVNNKIRGNTPLSVQKRYEYY